MSLHVYWEVQREVFVSLGCPGRAKSMLGMSAGFCWWRWL